MFSHSVGYYFSVNGFSYLRLGRGVNRPNIGAAYFTVLAFSVVSVLVFHFLVRNVLTVGLARYTMENRQGRAPFSTLFSGFSQEWGNIVRVMLRRDISVLIWSLFFVIPGIYRAYQTRMIPYLLAENPGLSARRAFELSRAAAKDELLRMILLDLSFLGWFALGTLALLLGSFFVLPYYTAVWAEFCAAMHAKLFALQITNETELSGFVRY